MIKSFEEVLAYFEDENNTADVSGLRKSLVSVEDLKKHFIKNNDTDIDKTFSRALLSAYALGIRDKQAEVEAILRAMIESQEPVDADGALESITSIAVLGES